jgi:hypothetical protein
LLDNGRDGRFRGGLRPNQGMRLIVPGQCPAITGEGVLTVLDADSGMARRVGLRLGSARRLGQGHPGDDGSNDGPGKDLGPVGGDSTRHQDARDDSGSFFLVNVIHGSSFVNYPIYRRAPFWHKKGRTLYGAACMVKCCGVFSC